MHASSLLTSLMVRLCTAKKAFFTHLFLSAAIMLLAAWLVLGVWFVYPWRHLAGGLHLLWVIALADVICGPLLTLVLFNPIKSKRELALDFSLVALLQLSALGYGLYSISLARPVILAFERDRFVAVSAAQVDTDSLSKALPEYQTLSWAGPRLVGLRRPRDAEEFLQSVELSLQGLEPSARPGWWQDYEKSIPAVQKRMQKLSDFYTKQKTTEQAVIHQAVQKTGIPLDQLFYLPLTSKKILDGWIVLLDEKAQIVGYAAVSGF